MHVLFVCLYMGTNAPLPHESKSVFAEFPGLVMRHKAIEVVCAQVHKDQAPPSHNSDVLGMSF